MLQEFFGNFRSKYASEFCPVWFGKIVPVVRLGFEVYAFGEKLSEIVTKYVQQKISERIKTIWPI